MARIEIQGVPIAPVDAAIQTMKIGHVDADLAGDVQNLMMAGEMKVAANYVAPKFRLGTKRSRR